MKQGNKESILQTSIEYLKGVGPARADLLKKELSVFTIGDLLMQFPFRYIDKTKFHRIRELSEDSGHVQLKGVLRQLTTVGEGRKRRLVGRLRDESGSIELVWFSGIHWLQKSLVIGKQYVVFGKINAFNRSLNIPHPEMEEVTPANTKKQATFAPVYSSTDKLNSKGLDLKARRKLMRNVFEKLLPPEVPENLPNYLLQKFRFPSRYDALRQIHFPRDEQELELARNRLKFEELFFLQLRLLQIKRRRNDTVKGFVFDTVGDYFNKFYTEKLPFELTGAQKRVVKEIRQDLRAGKQMNRLVQGDVGSGKTMVALLCMLMALGNEANGKPFQACMMAPTEILAQQHYQSLTEYLSGMSVRVAFLSGTVKGKKREQLLKLLKEGEIHILVGTHALIEDWVEFQNLGLAITDEQHRFGVAQRAQLWKKSEPHPPHVLVMTATPIPRTLAMTLYGDLDVSVIDEMPPGRKPVTTIHKTEHQRDQVIQFMKTEITKGRQVYVVYPLIEESEKLDLLALEAGYEALLRDFAPPDYQISVVHGRMKAKEKDY